MTSSSLIKPTVGYPYDLVRFDYTVAEKTIRFIEGVCIIPEGSHAGKPLVLEDFQKEFILDVFKVERSTGLRIVRQAILSIARKNGKTCFNAALTLAALCGPLATKNAELSSIALTRDQSGMVFRYLKGFIDMNHRLHDRLKVVESRKQVTDPKIGTHYTALSADARTQLGRSPAIFLWDEAGSFRQDGDLYSSMLTGQGAHENPLALILSTEAPSDQDLFSELIDYCIENPDDETQYLKRYTVPDTDDPYDERNWGKANPALGKFLSIKDLALASKKAEAMPGARSAFFNLRLNRRVDADESWISKDAWLHQPREGRPTFEDLRDRDVSLGIDLAMRRDLSAMVFTALDETTSEITVVPVFFMPAGAILERQSDDKVNYTAWADADLLVTPPGNSLNFEWCASYMLKLVEDYNLNITSGGYDRYKYDHLMVALEAVGAEDTFDQIEPFGQGYLSMSPAVDLMESLVYNERLWHGGLESPILTWNVANCVLDTDPANNRKITKKRSYSKVDGAVALAMALKTMDLESEKSYLDDEDVDGLFLI